MIQQASDAYLLRLTAKVEEQGLWHLHHRGVEPPTVQSLAQLGFAADIILTPIVNDGRWIVRCPHCDGAQFAAPTWGRFLCVDCANLAVGGRWLTVEWPAKEVLQAGEAALMARPDPGTRSWDPAAETIGALLAENVIFGALYDPTSGAVAGDIGADQRGMLRPGGDVAPRLGSHSR